MAAAAAGCDGGGGGGDGAPVSDVTLGGNVRPPTWQWVLPPSILNVPPTPRTNIRFFPSARAHTCPPRAPVGDGGAPPSGAPLASRALTLSRRPASSRARTPSTTAGGGRDHGGGRVCPAVTETDDDAAGVMAAPAEGPTTLWPWGGGGGGCRPWTGGEEVAPPPCASVGTVGGPLGGATRLARAPPYPYVRRRAACQRTACKRALWLPPGPLQAARPP